MNITKNMPALAQKSKPDRTAEAVFVITSAFLTAYLWRLRGEHGWGSFKGMALVAAGLLLLIVSFFAYKKKMTFEMFPVAILLTALTNSGWGTLNSQITGYLTSSVPFGDSVLESSVEINPLSAIAVMLCLGFGWAPLFASLLGWFFSDKKWSIKHFLLITILYYAVCYAAKATVAHPLLSVMSPQAVSGFSDGLADIGLTSSPYMAYLSHFDAISWAKSIPFGRNYFTSVEVISQAVAALAVFLLIRFAFKDKKAASLEIKVCLSFAAAITLADVFMFITGGGFRGSFTPPAWLSGWSNWEYFTGFFAGLFISLAVLGAAKKADCSQVNNALYFVPDKKPLKFIYNYAVLFCFPVLFILVIPFALKISYEQDFFFGSLAFDENMTVYILSAAAALLLIFPTIKFTKYPVTDAAVFSKAAIILLTAVFGFSAIEYFCFGSSYLLYANTSDTTVLMYITVPIIIAGIAQINKFNSRLKGRKQNV